MSWKSLLKTALAFVAIVWLLGNPARLLAQVQARPEAPPFDAARLTMQPPPPEGVALRAGRLFDPQTGTNLTNQVIVIQGAAFRRRRLHREPRGVERRRLRPSLDLRKETRRISQEPDDRNERESGFQQRFPGHRRFLRIDSWFEHKHRQRLSSTPELPSFKSKIVASSGANALASPTLCSQCSQ